MSKLLKKIQSESMLALKSGDKLRLSVLRLIIAAVKNLEISKRPDPIDDSDVMAVIAKEIKECEEDIKIYADAGKDDRVKTLQDELKILREYLPAMDEGAVEALVKEAIKKTSARSLADIGKIMGYVMPKVSGQATPDLVRSLAAKQLKE